MLAAPPPVVDLPERVRAIIRAQDRSSERLIGVMQVAIGVFLAGLYIASPRPLDASAASLTPVPVAIGAFLAFSLLRLWLIMRRPLPGWFVAVSILADVCLLLALIWSFHIQYAQPPGFSLKAPTFVYLFLLMALRTLRYDPRYVLASGLAAAFGWGVLTLATIHAAGPDAITRSYSAYVGGSQILIGAEVDKILNLVVVTLVLCLAARRGQQTLVDAVREEAAVKEIRRFLSRGVADQISRADQLIEAGHAADRDAAILMIDIRGFTPFSMSVPAKDVVQLLTSFHAEIIPIVRGNGGVIDKFLGDGIMATFGATEPSDSAAANALRALESVMDAARRWERSLPERGVRTPLVVNAAVASGPVVFATLGDGDRLEYTVIGEAVNLAAKLEKHNKVEKSRALAAHDTYRSAIAQGFVASGGYTLLAARAVAGVSQPIDLVALDG
jgi:adenylate cyclase